MSVLKVLVWPNTHLHDLSEPVTLEQAKSEEFAGLVQDMKDTMEHYHGAGLSAIQVGVPLRVFVMKTEKGAEVFVNPAIMDYLVPPVDMVEGCLSVPGVYETVKRCPEVILAALDLEAGEERLWNLEGVEAQCAQHEIEHLDGKTMMDRYGVAKRKVLKRVIDKTVLLDPAYL